MFTLGNVSECIYNVSLNKYSVTCTQCSIFTSVVPLIVVTYGHVIDQILVSQTSLLPNSSVLGNIQDFVVNEVWESRNESYTAEFQSLFTCGKLCIRLSNMHGIYNWPRF